MSAWTQFRFDLTTGMPSAWRVLRAHLSWRATLAVFCRFLWHSIWFRRPEGLALEQPGAQFTWRQLRPVLILERSLTLPSDADKARRRTILAEIVAETGAAFIASQVPIDPAQWSQLDDGQRRRLAEASLKRFGNAEARLQAVSPQRLSFDVHHCYFVELCSAMNRPELASLFCAADRRFFGGRDDVVLSRESTLAEGADHCAFRFRLPQGDDPP
ncbi:MAG: hypothetical protein CMH55_10085 [Myxococcales bacterium]|nr:hypothetical protein [Myxococcales bacterium]